MSKLDEHPDENESQDDSFISDKDAQLTPKTFSSKNTFKQINKDRKYIGIMKEGIRGRMSVLSNFSKNSTISPS